MKKETTTTIEILGRPYPIRCDESEIESLLGAAEFLEEKMKLLRRSGQIISGDRIAVIAALNMAHDLLVLEWKTNLIQQKLIQLQNKLDNALENNAEQELNPTE